MIHYKTTRASGFTLIELMLAMTFFASILMVSTIVLVQVFGIYNKGLAVRQINSVGRSLTDGIIRVGNSSTGAVMVGGYDPSTTNNPRCLGIGSNVYIWAYDSDSPSSANVYKTNNAASPDLVSLSRYKNPLPNAPAVCPPLGYIAPADLEPMLSSNIRVYAATVGAIGDATDLLRLRLVLGTYDGPGSSNNPVLDGSGGVRCDSSSLGNFCAFGTYDTVIYLPNS